MWTDKSWICLKTSANCIETVACATSVIYKVVLSLKLASPTAWKSTASVVDVKAFIGYYKCQPHTVNLKLYVRSRGVFNWTDIIDFLWDLVAEHGPTAPKFTLWIHWVIKIVVHVAYFKRSCSLAFPRPSYTTICWYFTRMLLCFL